MVNGGEFSGDPTWLGALQRLADFIATNTAGAWGWIASGRGPAQATSVLSVAQTTPPDGTQIFTLAQRCSLCRPQVTDACRYGFVDA